MKSLKEILKSSQSPNLGALRKILDNRTYIDGLTYIDRIAVAFQPDSFADFHDHPEFAEVFSRFTKNDPYRRMDVFRLWSLILNIKATLMRTQGALAEVGVHKGHSAAVLSYYAEQFARTIYLIDTFSGFPTGQVQEGIESQRTMAFKDTSLDQARDTVGTYVGNRWVVGEFPACVSREMESEHYAFVSLDCDIYEPILSGLRFFYPRTNKGGMIVVHDYSSGHWPGAKKAVDEFCKEAGVTGVLLPDMSGSIVVPR